MSEPSSWPLSDKAIRVRLTPNIVAQLATKQISGDCYPTSMGFYPRATKHAMKRRHHDDFIIMYCASGAGHISTEHFDGRVGQGDILIIPPGTSHYYHADEKIPWTLFWCHFRGGLARAFYEHIGVNEANPIVNSNNEVHLLAGFNQLIELAQNGFSIGDYMHSACLLKQLLTLVERINHEKTKEKSGLVLSNIQRYMRENLHRQINLDELAALSKLSKYHFSRKYAAITGVPPMQFFHSLKMQQACLQLEHEQSSIAVIAYDLGYDDPLYFSRIFKKVNGISPSQFRKKYSSKKLA